MNQIKKLTFIVTGSIIVFVTASVLCWFVYLPNKWGTINRKYIERITSIQFPKGTKTIETNDNGEFTTQGKFKLKTAEIESFIDSHPFKTLRKWDEVRFSDQFFLLPEKYQPRVENKDEFCYFQDCNPGNSWTYLLKITTGELWVEVQYPDWGGMASGCDK